MKVCGERERESCDCRVRRDVKENAQLRRGLDRVFFLVEEESLR